MTTLVVTIVSLLIYGRLAYECWPWEWRKTWYGTKDEMKYLRDVQWQHYNYGAKARPGWPHDLKEGDV